MNYEDGTKISVGNHIWWNEGSCIGFVHKIVEGAGEIQIWGFDEPHILISGHHPFAPDGQGYIAYPASKFTDEGIGGLSLAEQKDFESALNLARFSSGFAEPFDVRFDILEDANGLWVFGTYHGGEFREFARIKCEIQNSD